MSKSDWLGVALTAIGVAAGFLMGGTVAGIICLAIGLVALVVWHRSNDHGLLDPNETTNLGLTRYHRESSTLATLQALGATITFRQSTSGRPTRHEWEKAHTRFRKIMPDLDAEWRFDDGGNVTWNVAPIDRRASQEFTGAASIAGRLARRAGFVPTIFRPDETTSDEDYWLAVVASRIEQKSDWDAGFNAGFIDNVAQASRIVCDTFIDEARE
jgi:hypothetical protein